MTFGRLGILNVFLTYNIFNLNDISNPIISGGKPVLLNL